MGRREMKKSDILEKKSYLTRKMKNDIYYPVRTVKLE